MDLESPTSFSDFPHDIQINILSFLGPFEISALACTCRRFASLCSRSSPSAPLWLALCHRRWGSNTQLRRWSAAPWIRLYETLDRWEQLIGFWRRIGRGVSGNPPLVFFEWSSSCIIGSRISPSSVSGSYAVCKTPFLWLGLAASGERLTYLHPDSPVLESDVIPASISFIGSMHFVVEESESLCNDRTVEEEAEDLIGLEGGSPTDRVMSEIYQYFANRTSSGAEKAGRRQRKKKEKDRFGRRRWEAEHFVKILNYIPTPARPLQGLWKGISEDMILKFYLVTHDDVGGISCRRIGDSAEAFSSYSLVFWTSDYTFFDPPFSKEEFVIYSKRKHIGSLSSVHCTMDMEDVSRSLCINCSYDLVLPETVGSSSDLRNVEGRIWLYEDGTFGFGFLRNNFIVDLKQIALDGHILDEGISEDMILKFYHVEYDDIFGGICCWEYYNNSGNFVLFRTYGSHAYLESPFSKEELDIYSKKKHIRSLSSVHCTMDKEVVSRIMCITGEYDSARSSDDPIHELEGRIWLYKDGTFGFGFLKHDFIVDLKHIARNGHILDDV